MINLNISTMVYRPIRQVFEYVSTPENDFQWQYGTLSTTRLSEGTSALGSFFRSIANLMGHRIVGTYEVTEYEPNKKYGFTSRSGPLQSQTSYTFEMANGSTRITVSIQANAVNFFQMKEGTLTKGMKTQIRENLAMLKDLLEGKQILRSA
jgi:uncharacterized protein YndB with AHSA1/START domain